MPLMIRTVATFLIPVALLAGCASEATPVVKRIIQLEVTGSPNDHVSVVYPEGNGMAQNTSAYLPWRRNYEKIGSPEPISFTTTDISLDSDINLTCRIFVDGVEKAKVESFGGGTSVSCSGSF